MQRLLVRYLRAAEAAKVEPRRSARSGGGGGRAKAARCCLLCFFRLICFRERSSRSLRMGHTAHKFELLFELLCFRET